MAANEGGKRFYNDELPRKIEIPNVPVGAILKGSARRYGERTAYFYRDHEITFEQLYRESLRFANALIKMGICKGDVVATHLPTCPQYIAAYYGIVLAGATYSPVNPYLPSDDLLYQLNDCTARVVLTHETVAKSIQKCLEETQIEFVILTGDQEISSNHNPVDISAYGSNWYSFAALKAKSVEENFDVDIDPRNDLVHIAYTGGTTGRSKGVMLTHKNILANILQSAAWSAGCLAHVEEDGALMVLPAVKDKDKYLSEYPTFPGTAVRLSPTPLFHAAGAIGAILYPMLVGTTTILFDRFEPAKFLEDIEKFQASEVSGAPALFNFLLRHPDITKRDFSSVRVINSGAAPIAPEQMKLLQEYFPYALVTEGYGLTEATASVVNSVSFRSGVRKLGTVGRPIYNTEVKLIPIDGSSDEPLPIGETGEVVAKGPQVMKGYHNKPEETAETLKNGWLYTGDIGVFDEDGFLSIVDRKKEMLIYNGYNVYPRKLEELLFEHPAVANACVIGKPREDVGEIPKAFVVLKQGVTISAEDLKEFVNSRVVHYTKIRELEFTDQIPMTATGKILKRSLRDMEITKEKVTEQ